MFNEGFVPVGVQKEPGEETKYRKWKETTGSISETQTDMNFI